MYPDYFISKNKSNCYGCGACVQSCPVEAIQMIFDNEGFRYPQINQQKCIKCGNCGRKCPYLHDDIFHKKDKKDVFGGYNLDNEVRFNSTSGGAFSAICKTFFDNGGDCVFGACYSGTNVVHKKIDKYEDIRFLRKSKYSQSDIKDAYSLIKILLEKQKTVLFSGTPCEVAALNCYLKNTKTDNLLTVEVVCEGVPSPLYIEKYFSFLKKKYKSDVKSIDYRSKESKYFNRISKWDFQVEKIVFENNRVLLTDRWKNPFWQLWLKHLMSRPSCYECKFAKKERVADITLGDLWGVHIYCPELYGKNGGSSLVICNTEKGRLLFEGAKKNMFGHELNFDQALKYQSPLRKHIDNNPDRTLFMEDLMSNMSYNELIKKWYKHMNLSLFYHKYIWGNRQKVFMWNLTHRKRASND